MTILKWIGALLVLGLFPYRGIVQGAVLRNRPLLKTRVVVTISLGNLLLVGLSVALTLFGFAGQDIFPSPWFAVVFVATFIGGGVAGWKKTPGENQSHLAA